MNNLKKHKLLKIFVIIFIVIAVICFAVFLFLTLNPVFGGKASYDDMKDYQKRASNYINNKFVYPSEFEADGLSEDNRVSKKETTPEDKLPVMDPEISEALPIDKYSVTWFGHSTLLIQIHEMNLLIDPVFSQRSSPVSFAGPKRYTEPSLQISELPHIDAVIISHDHYDHLDMRSIKKLDGITDMFIVPLGVENHLERWKISSDKIKNMAWWEETQLNGLTIGCTPARHFSNRSLNDNGNTLFASWVFKDEYHQIFESGDTGYGAHFEKIHEKYGDFDLVLTDCAQYSINWHEVHMFPEEAAAACDTLGAKAAMPIHWCAFVLSNHGWDDSAERFTIASENYDYSVISPMLCETVTSDDLTEHQERWWRNYN